MVSRYFPGNPLRSLPCILIFIAVALIASLFLALTKLNSHANPSMRMPPRSSVYAADPDDTWNRIFYCLFTRVVKTRMSSDFDERAPVTRIQVSQSPVMGFPQGLPVSTRLFERVEIGDRAIEPLYPSFITSTGVSQVLSEPLYSQLKRALTDALEEKPPRPLLHRALMQSDVWAAYDLLFRNSRFDGAEGKQLRECRDQLLPLLARFIKKLALTSDEIDRLPDNYTSAARTHHLPRLFDQRSGWMEVQWFPERLHDHGADYRRATRVFIRPTSSPQDKQEFLNSLREERYKTSKLDAVALVTQNLLIDSNGKVVPTGLTYEVQFRRFIKSRPGVLVRTELAQYELSRKLLLTKPASGGLVSLNDKVPIYLPEAGNDYGFASLQRNHSEVGPPILVRLRSRCTSCHGRDVATVFTFSMHFQPPPPPVTQLNPSSNEHGRYVARRKMESEDFKVLYQQEGIR